MMFSRPHNSDLLFSNGIKRDPGQFHPQPQGRILNLGSGNAEMHGHIYPVDNLDLPDWSAPWLGSYESSSIAAVHMYHFLEHLDPTSALIMLAEVDRVLMPRGVAYIAVPHAMCPLAYQAPDHRSFWTEEGLQDTFYSAGYDTKFGGGDWNMDLVWMEVAGVKWSNMCVLAQLCERVNGIPYDTPWRRDDS